MNIMSNADTFLQLKIFGLTDVGQVREHNEDNLLVANLCEGARLSTSTTHSVSVQRDGVLLGVCDGMGGAAAGEVASQLAIDLVYEQMNAGKIPPNGDELARNMVHAIEFAGGHIFQEARADRSRRGMGTTSTIAVLNDSRLYLGQVGDSRAYLLRGEELKLLTRDQSLVNQLIEAGQLTEEEAETFEHNNIILQALGTSETVQVDLTYADIQEDDQIILCSDGLSGMIRDQQIKSILLESTSPEQACRTLVNRANAAGGHDNITVIVAQIEKGPQHQTADFGYRKYTLSAPPPAGQEAFADTGEFSAPDFKQELAETEPSEEAMQETRTLRVSHTMVDMTLPSSVQQELAEAQASQNSTAAPSFADAVIQTMPGAGDSNPEYQKNSSLSQREEEPVSLPTQRVISYALGLFLLAALLLSGVLLFLALD